jgi:hypothetical protein
MRNRSFAQERAIFTGQKQKKPGLYALATWTKVRSCLAVILNGCKGCFRSSVRDVAFRPAGDSGARLLYRAYYYFFFFEVFFATFLVAVLAVFFAFFAFLAIWSSMKN